MLKGYGHPLTAALPAAQNPNMSWSHFCPNYPKGPILQGADGGTAWGQTPADRALQEGHSLLSPTGQPMSISYFKAVLISLKQTDLKSGMMFQPSFVYAREALIQASADLNDVWSFLHIPIAPQPLVGFGSFLRWGLRPFLCSCITPMHSSEGGQRGR